MGGEDQGLELQGESEAAAQLAEEVRIGPKSAATI